MLKVESIKFDKKYKDIFSITHDEYKAAELLALSDGEIFQPLFVWKGQDILIYGYHHWKILKSHPEIKYTVREIEFQDWQEAQVWAIEHYIAQPETRLWQKLVAAIQCESYWLLKEDAKKAHGNRSELSSETEGDSEQSKEVNAIIARKVGCSTTYVYNFKRILSSSKKDIIALCRKGELTISAAYARLFLPKKSKVGKPSPQAPMELDIDGSNIFDDCEKNINIGKKNITSHNGIPVDPAPIAQQMKTTKIPDGAIWVTLHKKSRQMQVVIKNFDESTGVVHATVNSFNCKVVSAGDDIIILEADHINGGTEEFKYKDEGDLEEASKSIVNRKEKQ